MKKEKPKQEIVIPANTLKVGDTISFEAKANFKVEPKQETLEEVAERFLKDGAREFKTAKQVLIGFAKWQQQQNKNLYSEEDIINALHSLELKYNRDFSKIYQGIKEWFNQNKKK